MIARVSGRRIWAVVPWPGSEVSRTSPPSSRTLARTASMPTPRPEMSSASSRVEKPGAKSSSIARAMSIASACSGVISPTLTALAATAAGSTPRPSSATVIITLPPAWRAEIRTVPTGGLPAASRSAGVSRP